MALSRPLDPVVAQSRKVGVSTASMCTGSPWHTLRKPETVARSGLKVPGDFLRGDFAKLVVKAHAEVGIKIVETVCFLLSHMPVY